MTTRLAAPPLEVSDAQRVALERMARSSSLPHRSVVQAKALLASADGVAIYEVARRLGVASNSVRSWRRRFAKLGVDGVGVIAPGRGRRSWLAEGTVSEVVRVTLEETPDDGSTQWSTRTLAKRLGIGKDTVARIWADHHLKPWRVETFKVSTDPELDLLPESFVRWSRSIRRSLVTPTARRSTSCLCFAMTQPPAQSERIHALSHHPVRWKPPRLQSSRSGRCRNTLERGSASRQPAATAASSATPSTWGP